MNGPKHINQPLTNISINYQNSQYIADAVFPSLPVKKSSDNFYIYTTDFRLTETRRAYGAPAARATWAASTSSYQLEWHALADSITDKERENVDAPLSLDKDTTEFLTDKIMQRKEVEAAAVLFTTATWSNNRTITSTANAWHTSTAYPVQAVLSGTGIILANSGKKPNTGVMGWETYQHTRENGNLISRIQYTERAIVTPDIMAALFDLDKIHVGEAINDATQEGVTANPGFIWGDAFWMGYVAQPKRKMASAIAKITKNAGNVTKKWREENLESDMIEVQSEFQYRAMATLAGYVIMKAALG